VFFDEGAADNPAFAMKGEPAVSMIRSAWKASFVAAAVAAQFAGRLGAQDPPRADYYVYVAAESQDQVALVRFGPSGAEVVRTIEASLNPTDIDGPHGIAVAPDGSNWYVSIAHGLPYGQVQKFRSSPELGVRRGDGDDDRDSGSRHLRDAARVEAFDRRKTTLFGLHDGRPAGGD
jgi:hypothetical protein